MNSINKFSIINTNHETSFTIVKQTPLFTFLTDKLNFRFVQAFDYIQRFNLIIIHKSSKFHFVSNALFKLSINVTFLKKQFLNKGFDVLFTAFLMKMFSKFKEKLIKEYFMNLV